MFSSGPINMNHPRGIHSFRLSRLIPSKRQVPSQRQFPDVSHTDSRTYVNVPGSGFNAYSSHDTFDGYEQQPNYPEKNDKGGLQEIHNFDPPSQTSSQLLVSYTSSSHSSSHHSRPGHVRQSYGDEFEMTTPRQQSHPRVFERQQSSGGPLESRRQVLRY
ncbi:unnamed protein product [Calicophoron daubneyi]|uniref:Uncharacterized protein n=1 Tax=Calicophoron daubneyi TaxID=300641 RepID=A0AAV2TN57_CALDB